MYLLKFFFREKDMYYVTSLIYLVMIGSLRFFFCKVQGMFRVEFLRFPGLYYM